MIKWPECSRSLGGPGPDPVFRAQALGVGGDLRLPPCPHLGKEALTLLSPKAPWWSHRGSALLKAALRGGHAGHAPTGPGRLRDWTVGGEVIAPGFIYPPLYLSKEMQPSIKKLIIHFCCFPLKGAFLICLAK